ncbi:MAG: YggS family pyridoxal phosphate-dependent enzyme [Candidatus Hinthialibacter antarcticus]|nr:YggS family pyridoxal phosphate-dependent enzyme [Candidatus Hinthialibacter antarcticus]
MTTIQHNLETIRQQMSESCIQAGRDPEDVKLVAVSKLHPAEAVRVAYAAGQLVFGENRVQETAQKIPTLSDLPLVWHFIGHLQTNKIKKVLPLVSMIHTVDSDRLIAALQIEAEKLDRTIDVLLQVNVGGEEQKSGVGDDELETLIRALESAPRLICRGLMTVPPYEEDTEKVRPYFAKLRELGERYKVNLSPPGQRLELSMGMSHDFHVAIEEGATLIRIGTAIFGARNYG